jgi:hypothetical protein
MTPAHNGFGFNFYGYFIFAACWVAAYFAWAWSVNTRERRDNLKLIETPIRAANNHSTPPEQTL